MSPETDTVPQHRISRSPTLGHPGVGGRQNPESSRAPPQGHRAVSYAFVLCLAKGGLFVIRVHMNGHPDGRAAAGGGGGAHGRRRRGAVPFLGYRI